MILLNAARMASLATNADLSSLVACSSSPIYRSGSPAGNSSAGTLLYSADYSGALPSGVYATGTSTASIVSGALQLTYPANAISNSSSAAHDVSVAANNISDVYISFRAKMPNALWGTKFLKIFGKKSTTNTLDDTYSNTTFNLTYTSGALEQISFGDGSQLANDTAQVIAVAGGSQPSLGSRNTSAVISCPQGKAFLPIDWGTGWHTFKIRAKFNSGTSAGTEVADGAYYLEIDGNVYVNATGLFNRSWQSGNIEYIELGGYTQGSNPAFDMEFDDFRISTGDFA